MMSVPISTRLCRRRQRPVSIVLLFDSSVHTFHPCRIYRRQGAIHIFAAAHQQRSRLWVALDGGSPTRTLLKTTLGPLSRRCFESPLHSAAASGASDDIITGMAQVASDTGSSVPAAEGTKGANDKTSRRFRSGVNSYLKVELENRIMDRLHHVALELQATVKTWTESVKFHTDESNKPATPSEEQSQHSMLDEERSKRKPVRKRSLGFRPRSRNSLHITFFFGGETLCGLPENELVEWHQRVKDRLERSSFALESSEARRNEDAIRRIDEQSTCGAFAVKELSLFPPRRNYLIVAILEAPLEWHLLHDDVRDIARNGKSTGLSEITKHSKERWTPHVTLGNVRGGTVHELRKLSQYLAEQSFSSTEGNCVNWKVSAERIAMGGPIPEQVALDWNFVATQKTKVS